MNRRVAYSIVVAIALASTSAAIEAPLPRHPAPSPDGSQIAFSWQGDLWLVPTEGGQATRLTVHPAVERFPLWSRDGRLIAFASNRHGNDDVFVMPVDRSAAPTRLTFASTGDFANGFTPDGESVLFASQRYEGVSRGLQLWTVPLSGGTPAIAQDAFVQSAAYSPDGESLVFVRGGTKWTRRGYRGSGSRDLWLRTPEGAYTRLTDFDGDDDSPSWLDNGTIAFLSSRSGRKNVFRLDIATGEATQLTSHEGSAVRFPRASANGRLIAYEFEDGLWTVTPDGGQPIRLSIQVPADEIKNPVQRKVSTDDADELAVSPDGTLVAFIVNGDVFVTAIASRDEQQVAKPFTARVTATPERERDLSWSTDGTQLLFSSAVNGNDDLYLARRLDEDTPWPESFDFELTRLTDSPDEEYAAQYSPDGGKIAFVRGKGNLVLRNTATGNEMALLNHWDTPRFDWSPDGEWLAYSVADENFNDEVWIMSANGGTPYNVSRHPDNDYAPHWSPDGRRLVWTARRSQGTFDIWGLWLTRADHERTASQWLKAFAKDAGKDKKKVSSGNAEGDDREKKPQLPHVTIEFERLWERVERITDLKGDEGRARISPDGRTIVFTAEHEGDEDLYSIDWNGEDLKRLTKGGTKPEQYVFDEKGKSIFFLDGRGRIKNVGIDGKSGDPIPFSARYEIDSRLERATVFDEAWRALNLFFYDPDFHGVDWPAQHEKYRPWALAASTRADFADVVNLMLGELNSSHIGYRPAASRNPARDDADTTGWVGITYDPTAGGPGLLVSEVLPDSPAWRTDAGIEKGERLLAVNGEEVTATKNVFGLFVDTVDQRTQLRVLGVDGVERTVVVKPIGLAGQRQLRYEEWVRERRRLTDEWSGGRLGYIHIQGMNTPSFEEFERMLYAAANGREGLLVDVRFNGGGRTTDYVMAVLMVRRHAYTVPRGADPVIRAYPQDRLPLAAWTRPAATLCNEQSYSNAEIFSYAFQTLERGSLVGWPTFGAVISTGAMWTLDGGRVRLPGRGWFVASTGVNMENNGAVPDVQVVQPPPEDRSSTEDSQLRRAVEVLLAELGNDPRTGAW
jgi:tricorn protease